MVRREPWDDLENRPTNGSAMRWCIPTASLASLFQLHKHKLPSRLKAGSWVGGRGLRIFIFSLPCYADKSYGRTSGRGLLRARISPAKGGEADNRMYWYCVREDLKEKQLREMRKEIVTLFIWIQFTCTRITLLSSESRDSGVCRASVHAMCICWIVHHVNIS